jgi:hypothetical protein
MFKTRLTAAEARKLAGPTVQERVDDILVAIEKLAKQGKRQLRTGWDYDKDRELWIDGGYSNTPEWREAIKILSELGYKAQFYYNCGQFVDMYTLIKW